MGKKLNKVNMALPTYSVFIALGLLACFAPEFAQGLSVHPWRRCGPVCKIGCPCGNVLNYRGCPICACKKCLTMPPARVCDRICPAIACLCGKETDSNGCPTCGCKRCPKPTPNSVCGPTCEIPCPCGKVTGPDGCPTCQCRQCVPDKCLHCCGAPPCCNYCGLERLLRSK